MVETSRAVFWMMMMMMGNCRTNVLPVTLRSLKDDIDIYPGSSTYDTGLIRVSEQRLSVWCFRCDKEYRMS